MIQVDPYNPIHKIRIVTAASLFDGHDAAINIMRRIMQRSGAEIIHLGHNRAAQEIVDTAIQEDVQGIAITSYQGGHIEYFKYIYDLLKERNASHIKIFGGGGGTILPSEIAELQDYGITRIYSPDDGRELGLQGMINDVLERCDYPIGEHLNGEVQEYKQGKFTAVARMITSIENYPEEHKAILDQLEKDAAAVTTPVLGITGTGGAGKSSLVDEIIRRFSMQYPDMKLGIISVDPSKRKTGGALLGDRIRMNSIISDNIFMRSLATRQSNLALSRHIQGAVNIMKTANFDFIILETSGIGQSDTEIVDHSDISMYVMTPDYGAATQLEKIDMLDFADIIALNKFDKRGALDALRDVKKQYRRNHNDWEIAEEDIPVFGTIASQFNDPGVNVIFNSLVKKINEKTSANFENRDIFSEGKSEKIYIIPPARTRYLSEISERIRAYNENLEKQAKLASDLYALDSTMKQVDDEGMVESLKSIYDKKYKFLDGAVAQRLENWSDVITSYKNDEFIYHVRGREIRVPTFTTSLSGSRISRVSVPRFTDWGDIVRWQGQENFPGFFPYAAGVFPFKRKGEDPTRMFAGEGGPERTNKRFHYLSEGMPAKRLSTAFDSVTLYGEDPDYRPDIYGKIGNAGVSIASLDDAKRLYSGFDLCDKATSVSMTINGPAAIICAFFMNAAIDQQCEKYIKEHGLESKVEEKKKEIYEAKGLKRPTYRAEIPEGNNGLGLMLLGLTGDQVLDEKTYAEIKAFALSQVRGTVQADILKEDQAQNTCIFSTEFSLKLMGDVQQYFIDQAVRNFYSVSISGYHIAEAGANPITQLAFTLSNGFTYVEYYLSRGMDINAFAPNLSFFFSNGIDPEYSVIGRVARKIWAKALKEKYGANERAQKLKYHIQTSGRSLHAQEISFNDIRTTLQALYAIYDNCNSLHTNAYDEAITTPTEESVRRAVAIQMIINHELGLAKNENPLQGSFIIEELTDLVENAVLEEFDRITERGGVLGAMESMYQRGKIQDESLHYETLKHTGEFPIIGVNTFLDKDGSPTVLPREVIRAEKEEKVMQISGKEDLHVAQEVKREVQKQDIMKAAINHENVFEVLMEATKVCSLGDLTQAMYKVGGQYRRNM